MKRKIIKQGNNTLTVTLPRTWTDSYKIKPGDELNLDFKGNKIIMSTERLLAYDKKVQDISKLACVLPSVLLSIYRKGYEEVELTFEKPQTAVIIQGIINHTGYHIVEQRQNSCTLRSLSEVNDLNFNEILRKVFIHVKMKLEAIANAVTRKELYELQSITAMNSVPARMTNFCYRLVMRGNTKDSDKSSYYYSLLNDLENLDNHLNLMINDLFRSCSNVSSARLKETIVVFHQIYSEFYSSYFEYSLEKFIPVIQRKVVMSEQIAQTLADVGTDENRLFLSLNNSFLCFSSMINTAMLMNL